MSSNITVAHTPDADDAFMFYALVTGRIRTRLKIKYVIDDIETLNRMAFKKTFDVTALSVHAYAYLSDRYRILSAGASVGNGYGPIVVSRDHIDLKGSRIAIPGRYTTSYLLLKLAVDDFKPVEMRFDEIINAVKDGKVDAGLLIHEGQITYEEYGLKKVFDIWEWWFETTRLPLPLGINVISRDIPEKDQIEFLRAFRESIMYALNNVDEALEYAMKYSRGMNRDLTRRFALMYVNEYTLKMPEDVVKAIEKLYEMSEMRGFFRKPVLDILY